MVGGVVVMGSVWWCGWFVWCSIVLFFVGFCHVVVVVGEYVGVVVVWVARGCFCVWLWVWCGCWRV